MEYILKAPTGKVFDIEAKDLGGKTALMIVEGGDYVDIALLFKAFADAYAEVLGCDLARV